MTTAVTTVLFNKERLELVSDTRTLICILALIHFRRKTESADNIPYVKVTKESSANQTMGAARISWPPPPRPNGVIVSYTIRFQRVDLEHSKGQDLCITHRMYKQSGEQYVMKHLENGNYSFMVMATSLAGAGAFSAPQFILIDVSFRMVYVCQDVKNVKYFIFIIFRNQILAIGKFSLSHWEFCWR